MNKYQATFLLVILAAALAADIKLSFDSLKDLGLGDLNIDLGNIELDLSQISGNAMKDYFAKYDKDNSGGFDFNEFITIYQDEEKPFSDETILKHFQEADADSNGVVDYDEIFYFALKQASFLENVQLADDAPKVEQEQQQQQESTKQTDL
ncbi:EF-hand protein (macronuclear) [Tetrahymena thermophila SB210]|uniref:EF-hand protein n=1 Tax=Tetrahymena thermophila (strain SB210) TaxID=312017 RepID=I7LUT0_TETTS|nr:EF-hand protein [Tetrahymena thermophila SB210]EAR95981.1 EF-hand protein [Tetrahymena thermophila SB210]|eukprot:XP_001016226.1 EF-hand protein [Tetrahymena thermophila SB210]